MEIVGGRVARFYQRRAHAGRAGEIWLQMVEVLGDTRKCAKRGLEPGDIGPGSYGAAFTHFPTAEDPTYDAAKGVGGFDQIAEIIKQIKERPELKAHFISPWIPQYTIRNHDGGGSLPRVDAF